MNSSLQEKLSLLERQLTEYSQDQNYEKLFASISGSEEFIRQLDVSVMSEAEKKSFISFSNTHHEVMSLVSRRREETLNELKKFSVGKKKIQQYKGVKNSAE